MLTTLEDTSSAEAAVATRRLEEAGPRRRVVPIPVARPAQVSSRGWHHVLRVVPVRTLSEVTATVSTWVPGDDDVAR